MRGSVTTRAVPSMMTGSDADSVLMTQCGSARRFLALRDPAALENQSVLSSHMAQTGIRCGRPVGRTVATQ